MSHRQQNGIDLRAEYGLERLVLAMSFLQLPGDAMKEVLKVVQQLWLIAPQLSPQHPDAFHTAGHCIAQ